MFRNLAEGPKTIRLSNCHFVHLKNIREVKLCCIGDDKEPARRLQPDNKMKLSLDSLPEGWIWCAELAEGLKGPSHQYFDYGENNTVGIEAAFLDDRV